MVSRPEPAIRERIIERFSPLQLILFGSRARGGSRADSDIDLLIVLEDCTDKRESAIQIRRCLADMPIGIDVVVTCPEEIAHRGHIIGSVLGPALRKARCSLSARARLVDHGTY